jgi:hypothetical protein
VLEITGKRLLLSHKKHHILSQNIAGSICYLWEACPRGERALHFLTIRLSLITIFLALSTLLGSCATTTAPDLQRLYAIGKDSRHTMTVA